MKHSPPPRSPGKSGDREPENKPEGSSSADYRVASPTAETDDGSADSSPAYIRKTGNLMDTPCVWIEDNLEALDRIPDETIDLIYLDPPFATGRIFRHLSGDL